MNKWNTFSYLVAQLVAWSDEVSLLNQQDALNQRKSLTKLKLIKLLFFASAVDTSVSGNKLLDVFDNFYAMPYGHVESDVYNEIVQRGIFDYSFISGIDVDSIIDAEERAVVDIAVTSLREKNVNLISYDANQLVALSHEWYSWKSTYSLARALKKYSMKIPSDVIKKEVKFYYL